MLLRTSWEKACRDTNLVCVGVCALDTLQAEVKDARRSSPPSLYFYREGSSSPVTMSGWHGSSYGNHDGYGGSGYVSGGGGKWNGNGGGGGGGGKKDKGPYGNSQPKNGNSQGSPIEKVVGMVRKAFTRQIEEAESKTAMDSLRSILTGAPMPQLMRLVVAMWKPCARGWQ